MEEELSLNNILSSEEASNLFLNEETEEETPTVESEEETKETEETNQETVEVNPEDLFSGDPESVDSEENQGEEGTAEKSNTSPNFYSSIANALTNDGIFQNLDEETLNNIKTAEDFAELISNQVKNQLDERQKRIDEALNYGVEPSEIKKYEQYLGTLNDITEEQLTSEDESGENLRKNIIYQDYINRGFSKERALREIKRSFDSGSDIEDAKESLKSNIEFFSDQYNDLVKEAKKAAEEEKREQLKQAEQFKNTILESKKAFGDLEIDKVTRQKVYDSIMKPVYTDPDTGKKLSAIQKYESENRNEFLKNLGLVYVLTDGFKNLGGILQGKVKKEVKKGLRELENTINGSNRTSTGSLNFTSGVDPNSKFIKWTLDV